MNANKQVGKKCYSSHTNNFLLPCHPLSSVSFDKIWPKIVVMSLSLPSLSTFSGKYAQLLKMYQTILIQKNYWVAFSFHNKVTQYLPLSKNGSKEEIIISNIEFHFTFVKINTFHQQLKTSASINTCLL